MLVDFGIARTLDAEPLTATGTVVGTADYISPEQTSGQIRHAPVGRLLARAWSPTSACTGHRPFHRESHGGDGAGAPARRGAALADEVPPRRTRARGPHDRPGSGRASAAPRRWPRAPRLAPTGDRADPVIAAAAGPATQGVAATPIWRSDAALPPAAGRAPRWWSRRWSPSGVRRGPAVGDAGPRPARDCRVAGRRRADERSSTRGRAAHVDDPSREAGHRARTRTRRPVPRSTDDTVVVIEVASGRTTLERRTWSGCRTTTRLVRWSSSAWCRSARGRAARRRRHGGRRRARRPAAGRDDRHADASGSGARRRPPRPR